MAWRATAARGEQRGRGALVLVSHLGALEEAPDESHAHDVLQRSIRDDRVFTAIGQFTHSGSTVPTVGLPQAHHRLFTAAFGLEWMCAQLHTAARGKPEATFGLLAGGSCGVPTIWIVLDNAPTVCTAGHRHRVANRR